MKRAWNLIVLTLAGNFVLAAGGIGWLAKTGHLTRPRVAEIRKVLFPPPPTPPAPTTRPAVTPPPDAAARLGDWAARAAGRPLAERALVAQQVQDTAVAMLDDRSRELLDLRSQVELAQSQLDRDRAALAKERQAFAAERDRDAATAADKGFQDSLALYRTLPPKQVKAIFATLPDDAVQRYLQAMDAKQATKVMKEFKSPAETDRLQRVLERIRATPAATRPAAAPAADGPTDPATAAVPDGR